MIDEDSLPPPEDEDSEDLEGEGEGEGEGEDLTDEEIEALEESFEEFSESEVDADDDDEPEGEGAGEGSGEGSGEEEEVEWRDVDEAEWMEEDAVVDEMVKSTVLHEALTEEELELQLARTEDGTTTPVVNEPVEEGPDLPAFIPDIGKEDIDEDAELLLDEVDEDDHDTEEEVDAPDFNQLAGDGFWEAQAESEGEGEGEGSGEGSGELIVEDELDDEELEDQD